MSGCPGRRRRTKFPQSRPAIWQFVAWPRSSGYPARTAFDRESVEAICDSLPIPFPQRRKIMFSLRQDWLRLCLLATVVGLGSSFVRSAWAQKPDAGDAVSVPQLIKNLDSDAIHVAASAARSLGFIFAPGGKGGDELPKVTALLIERLESPKGAELRKESATALGRIRAAAATEGLKKAMGDEDIEVAMAAGEAVGQILPVDEARAFLIKRAADGSESVLVASYHGLAPISKPEDAAFLIQGLATKNWRSQMDSVRGLQRAVQAGAQLPPEAYDAVAAVMGCEIINAADAASQFCLVIRNSESLRAVLKAAETGGGDTDADRACAPGPLLCGPSFTWAGRSPATRCRS